MSAKRKVAVLISGRGSNLKSLIEACALADFPAQIVLVLSNKADAPGFAFAKEANIATQVISHRDHPDREAFDAAIHAALIEAGAEFVCLAGFMRLLTPSFVAKWEGRMLNIHPSLLPAFPGLDTHRLAIEMGVKLAGATVHFVTAEMDSGPIVIQAAVPVLPGDTPQMLAARILEQEHAIYPQALRWLAEGKLAIQNKVVKLSASVPASGALQNPRAN